MRIQNTEIPQGALDAGRAAMVDGFTAMTIQTAVSVALRADGGFYYPREDAGARDTFDMRVADRMIQNARRDGRIIYANKRWSVARQH